MGETLSHASYPGLMLSALFLAYGPRNAILGPHRLIIDAVILFGALLTSSLGLYLYSRMRQWRIYSDAALGWILASFLGIGVLIASRLQFAAPTLYQRVQTFLYGQASTLAWVHVQLFFILFLVIIISFWLGYRLLLSTHFDREFAKANDLYRPLFQAWIHILTSSLVVTGIRAGGVLVMAALLVAPAVAGRTMANSMAQMGFWALIVGALCGLLGNILSMELETWAHSIGFEGVTLLPTGPAIALVACTLAVAIRLFWPNRGIAYKLISQRAQKKMLLKMLQRQQVHEQ